MIYHFRWQLSSYFFSISADSELRKATLAKRHSNPLSDPMDLVELEQNRTLTIYKFLWIFDFVGRMVQSARNRESFVMK